MKSLKFMLSSLVLFASCSAGDDAGNPITQSPIILVHGAWQGDYVWVQTKANLTGAGYRVKVVTLPGHGTENTPANQVTFQSYVNEVKKAIDAFNEPVMLVGHSLGGAIITQTAAELPQKIGKLVYVAGFIPESGKSVLDYSMKDSTSLLPAALRLSEDQTEAGIADPAVNLPKIFCQDGTAIQQKFLVDLYKAEPTIPLGTPLNYQLNNYQAAGKKYYIHTTADQTITYGFQQKMASAAGITNTYTINAGHSPFISRPNELTEILRKIAKQ